MKTFTKNLTLLLVLISLSHFAYSSDYYWVGGSGDFNNLSHWSTSSGGNDFYTTVPSADDNVFFDANSFSAPGQTVTISSDVVCRDMNWTGANNPILSNNSWLQILRIYGSLSLTPNMTFNFQGRVFFDATSVGNTIDMADKTFQNIVTFRGNGGGWTLMSDLKNTDSLRLENGTLNTNGQNVYCLAFGSEFTGARSLILGNSVITVIKYFRVFSSNLNLSCGTSLIKLQGYNADLYAGNNLYFNKVIFTNDSSNNLTLSGNSAYHSLIFAGGGSIYGSNSFDTLVFFPGKMYVIGANNTEVISDLWSISGTCAGKISIQSSLQVKIELLPRIYFYKMISSW